MNKYYQTALNTQHDRRPVFDYCITNYLASVDNPKIVEIGCSRNLDERSIFGDGYADIYWADFILRHGRGSLTIVDIDPCALEKCKIILDDFIGKIDIEFVCDDGIKYLKTNQQNYNFFYLDGSDAEWQTFEMFKAIDLRNGAVLIDDFNPGGKADRLKQCYPFYNLFQCNHIHQMGWYNRFDNYGDKEFYLGRLNLPYYRGWKGNREATNNRAVEIALVNWFRQKYNNEVIEIGDVSCHYEGFEGHTVIDPYGPYVKSIRKDVLDWDYTSQNVVSVSTWEHLSEGAYNNNDQNKPIKALQKILRESKNYLITFDIGGDRYFEDWLMTQTDIQYTFMLRQDWRGLINNWCQSNNPECFYYPYLHWEYNCGYYGNAAAICVVSNCSEIVG